jgi:hypothetical protein
LRIIMSVIKRFSGITAVIIFLVSLLGCRPSSSWPPKSPAKSPISGFTSSLPSQISGLGQVFKDEGKARNTDWLIGQALLFDEVDYELPFNLFTIEAPRDAYVESQFEVLYFDAHRTQIRAVKAEGDRIALIKGAGSASFACTYPGAKIRCGGQVYELHTEGWRHNGKLVHAFDASGGT